MMHITERFTERVSALFSKLALEAGPAVILLWSVGGLLFGWLAACNHFDYDLREMIGGSGEIYDRYQECVRLFGPDDEIILAWPCSTIDQSALERSLAIREAVQAVQGVTQVFDITQALGVRNHEHLVWMRERPRLLERRVSELKSSGLLNSMLFSRTGKAIAAYVRTADLTPIEKHSLVKAVRTAISEIPEGEVSFPSPLPPEDSGGMADPNSLPSREKPRAATDPNSLSPRGRPGARGKVVHLGGYPVFGERYVTLMMEGNSLFAGLSLAASLLVSLALFRSIWLTASVALAIGFPAIWTQGLYAMLGYRISLFSSLLTPMMLFVALSLAIQFIARYRLALEKHGAQEMPDAQKASGAQKAPDSQGLKEKARRKSALREALHGAFPPSLLCAVTTFIGFASQSISGMPGVRAFGILSSIGCAFAFLSVFLFLPALLLAGPTPGSWGKQRSLLPSLEKIFGRWTARYAPPPGWAMPLAWIMLFACIPGITHLKFGSDPLSALPPDDPVVVAHEFWREHFSGSGRQISLVCRSSTGSFDRLTQFRALDRFAAAVASDPEVVTVLSIAGLIRDIAAGLSGAREAEPKRDSAVERALRFAAARSPQLLNELTNPPYFDRARLVVGLRQADAPVVVAAAKRIEMLSEAASDQDSTITASATGRMLLSAIIENNALNMELSSFLGALSWIIAIFAVAFRNGMTVWVAVIVNLLPIIFTTSMMGLVGQALNPVTLMVPCIGIGVVVDDTTHLIHEIGRETARGHGPTRARACVMLRIGWAIVSTSGILMIGMGVLMFSSFAPIRQFGTYAGLTLGIGMLTDLFLTPAFLLRSTTAKKMKTVSVGA